MENIESSHGQLSLAGEISVSQKNNILTDIIILQISGRKQISAQTVINGTTVPSFKFSPCPKSTVCPPVAELAQRKFGQLFFGRQSGPSWSDF